MGTRPGFCPPEKRSLPSSLAASLPRLEMPEGPPVKVSCWQNRGSLRQEEGGGLVSPDKRQDIPLNLNFT